MPLDILSWKKKWGSIYLIEVDHAPFYFRPLTVEEFTIFEEWPPSIPSTAKEDAIISTTLLWPSSPPFQHDALSNADLAWKIQYMSMPSGEEQMKKKVDTIRERIGTNPHKLLVANICSVFPTYNPSDLTGLTFEKLLEIAVIVEKITGKAIIGSKRIRSQNAPQPTAPDPSEMFKSRKRKMHDPNELALAHVHHAEDALADEIQKYTGKRPPKASETREEKEAKLSELHRQMKSFSSR